MPNPYNKTVSDVYAHLTGISSGFFSDGIAKTSVNPKHSWLDGRSGVFAQPTDGSYKSKTDVNGNVESLPQILLRNPIGVSNDPKLNKNWVPISSPNYNLKNVWAAPEITGLHEKLHEFDVEFSRADEFGNIQDMPTRPGPEYYNSFRTGRGAVEKIDNDVAWHEANMRNSITGFNDNTENTQRVRSWDRMPGPLSKSVYKQGYLNLADTDSSRDAVYNDYYNRMGAAHEDAILNNPGFKQRPEIKKWMARLGRFVANNKEYDKLLMTAANEDANDRFDALDIIKTENRILASRPYSEKNDKIDPNLSNISKIARRRGSKLLGDNPRTKEEFEYINSNRERFARLFTQPFYWNMLKSSDFIKNLKYTSENNPY